MKFFIQAGSEQLGPLSKKEVHARLSEGRFLPDDLGWHEGAPGWLPLYQIDGLAPLPASKALVVAGAPSALELIDARMVAPAPILGGVETGRNCPFCAELIQPAALKCRHCGEALDPRLRAMEESRRAISQRQAPVYVNQSVQMPHYEQRREYPFVFHLLITLFTGGLWIPIWVLCYLARDKQRYL